MRYKLTTQDCKTHHGHEWSAGVWLRAAGESNAPCSNGVVHYYDSPHAAMLFNPVHAAIASPLLWEFETREEIGHDGLKGWCKEGRIVRAVPLPDITTEQRAEFAIRCAMLVYKDAQWLTWAHRWLAGVDRTAHATHAANAAYAAADAAADAANAAAREQINGVIAQVFKP